MFNNEEKALRKFLKEQKKSAIECLKYWNKERLEQVEIGRTIVYDIILWNKGDSEGFKIEFDTNGFIIKGEYYWRGFVEGGEIELTEEEAEIVADYFGLPL